MHYFLDTLYVYLSELDILWPIWRMNAKEKPEWWMLKDEGSMGNAKGQMQEDECGRSNCTLRTVEDVCDKVSKQT
jgi:hypothetical protein